MNKIIHDSMKQ